MNNMEHCKKITHFDLTHPQKRIWYTEIIFPNTSINNIGGTVHIKGKANLKLLEESIDIFVKRNDGLRLVFNESKGNIKQYIKKHKTRSLDFHDFSKEERPEQDFLKWVKQEALEPFKLENTFLYKFALFKISDEQTGYLCKFHHLIADGWSINIMTEQIGLIYEELISGIDSDIKDGFSYRHFIEKEKKYLLSNRFTKNKLFWLDKFKDFPKENLGIDGRGTKGSRATFELSTEISQKIKDFTDKNNLSLNTFFITLYLIYLNKTTQQKDIVIGTPVFNRYGKKEKKIFGMCTSTMPFRFFVDETSSVNHMLQSVNESLQKCYMNQKYPYDLLCQDLELKKKGYDKLHEVSVNYYNTRLNNKIDGMAIENVEFYNGNQLYSLQLIIKDWSVNGNLTLEFDYKISVYDDVQIDELYHSLITLIDQIVLNKNRQTNKLMLLSKQKAEAICMKYNDTKTNYPKDKTIDQLFEEQAERTPERIALSHNNRIMTYRELNEKSNQIARLLRKAGVGKEDIVGLLVSHSIETLIGILAITKAGGAYLPIDPHYPDRRISYMLQDSGCKYLMTNQDRSRAISFEGHIVQFKDPNLYTEDKSNLKLNNKRNQLVYVIYTSGSTGTPKGTMIEHQGLVNYVWWAKKMYLKQNQEIFPLYSSLAFDLTVTSIFTPLISGNQIAIYSEDLEEDYVLFRIMNDNRATIVKLTPSHLSLLKDKDYSNSSVHTFIVGGEDLKLDLVQSINRSFGGKIDIYNEYGPTETVVGCMIHKYNPEMDKRASIPIGRPADNVKIYILDKYYNPLPSNIVGELFISGDGIARGYLNKPELTAEKFIKSPFVNEEKMYRTGDLGRFIGTDIIEYVGRLDQQVKILGHRIELGEIEKYMMFHESVKEVVVLDHQDKRGTYLCAYIIKKKVLDKDELRKFLLKYLPQYMIPIHIVELKEFPLTSNGKIDRMALSRYKNIDVKNQKEIVIYRNEKEKLLINTINELLNINIVNVKENFYHLGGDSIKAIQMTSKLSEKGFKIRVKDILDNPIIEKMALFVDEKHKSIEQKISKGSIKNTPIVSWFLSQEFKHINFYNQSIMIELNSRFETIRVTEILNKIIEHHDALRMNYNRQHGRLFYNHKHLKDKIEIEEYELGDVSPLMQDKKISMITNRLIGNCDIENELLIKACIFNYDKSKKLFITAHHLIVDGISWRIILEDFNTLHKQIKKNQKLHLPLKTYSYQTWAEMLEHYSKQNSHEEEQYWKNIMSKKFQFPLDHKNGLDTMLYSNTAIARLSKGTTLTLTKEANESFHTEPIELLITSLLRTIKTFVGVDDIVIELEGHGREDIFDDMDVSRTVGWFTSIYPFYAKLTGEDLFTHIIEVKEKIRKIPNNGINFGVMKYLSKTIDDKNKRYIRFNYLGNFTTRREPNSLNLENQFSLESHKDNHLTSIMDINCYIIEDRLNVLLTYSKEQFYERTVNHFIDLFISNIEDITTYCCHKETMQFTPSDFDTVDLSLEDLDNLIL